MMPPSKLLSTVLFFSFVATSLAQTNVEMLATMEGVLECAQQRVHDNVMDCALVDMPSLVKISSTLARPRTSMVRKQSKKDTHTHTHTLEAQHDGVNGTGGGIAVVSVCHGAQYAKICLIAKKNMESYCNKHGYRLFFHDQAVSGSQGRLPVWEKIPAIQEALANDDISHAFFMDSDSLFMSLGTPIEFLLPRDGAFLTMTGDHNCMLNSGHLMFSKAHGPMPFWMPVGILHRQWYLGQNSVHFFIS